MELCCEQLLTIAAKLMELCCVQLITIAAELTELCCVQLLTIAAELMELCCEQLIITAAELMELCCEQLKIIAATLVELCAVDCPKIDAGWSCNSYYKREDCGKNGYVKDPMYCPILCGVCPGELYTVPSSVECVPVSCVYCRTHYGVSW